MCVCVYVWAFESLCMCTRQKKREKQAAETDKRKNTSQKIKGTAHPNMTQYVNHTSIVSICNYRWGEKGLLGMLLCVCGPCNTPDKLHEAFSSPRIKQFTQLEHGVTHTHYTDVTQRIEGAEGLICAGMLSNINVLANVCTYVFLTGCLKLCMCVCLSRVIMPSKILSPGWNQEVM